MVCIIYLELVWELNLVETSFILCSSESGQNSVNAELSRELYTATE